MQEEVTRKTIALAIKTAKLDGKVLQAALRKLLQLYRKARDTPHRGKQTLKQLAPEVKELTRTEMTELMEHIFGLPEVQRAVRHMEITHINQANREKELKAHGTIPLHSDPNETQ